jgi:lambda repressor-like predicted transcriptional regulator
MSKQIKTSDIPTRSTERKAWVLFQLKVKGSSFSALGREIGVSYQAVAWAAGGRPAFEVEKAIAAKIGVPSAELFPEHYDEHGERVPLARTTQHKGKPQAENGNVYSREMI